MAGGGWRVAGQRGNTPAHTQVPLGGEARAAGWLVGWDGWREWAPHTPSPVAERMALGVHSVGRGEWRVAGGGGGGGREGDGAAPAHTQVPLGEARAAGWVGWLEGVGTAHPIPRGRTHGARCAQCEEGCAVML